MPWLEINFLFWLPGALKSTLTSSLFQGIHTTRKLENTTQYSIGILIANKIFDGNLSLLSYLSGIVVLSVFLLATKVAICTKKSDLLPIFHRKLISNGIFNH
jgi:hypothetical protein